MSRFCFFSFSNSIVLAFDTRSAKQRVNQSIASTYNDCIAYIEQGCLEPLDFIRCSNSSESVECRLQSEGCSDGFTQITAPNATFRDEFTSLCDCQSYQHHVLCETTANVWDCQLDYENCASNSIYPLSDQVYNGPLNLTECQALINFDICDDTQGSSRCVFTLEGCNATAVEHVSFFCFVSN